MTVPDSTGRALVYPLRHPLAQVSQVGVADYHTPTLTWITSDPEERVTVSMELSLNEYVAVSSALDVGRDIAYGAQSEYIWWLWTRAFIKTSSGTVEPIKPSTTNVVAGGIVEVIVINEDESMLKIENIDGVPYLEQDCGCGVRKYYVLTGASVNPQTGAISGGTDTVPSYISNVPLTESQIADCYADKVADTIIAALSAYTDAVFGYALYGAAVFAPIMTAGLLGAIEIQQSINAALNGDLTLDFSNVGYTASEVIDVFESSEFRQFIVDRLGDDQQVARWVLELVALRLLNRSDLNFPTPVYPVFAAWTRMANMASLNLALEQSATECATGNSTPDTSDFTVVEDGGVSYLLYTFQSLPLQDISDTYLTPDMSGTMVAYIVDVPHSVNPGGADFVRIGIDIPSAAIDTYSRAAQDGNGGVLVTYSGAINTDVLDIIVANTDLTSYDNYNNVSFPSGAQTAEVTVVNKTAGQVIGDARLFVLMVAP